VKQILYTYLSNAIKFTPDGGRVEVRVVPEGRSLVRIDVEDSGVGMEPEHLGKLFVEFQQLDSTTGKRYQGTGLGLALTKRIAEAHGGRVDVRSTPGQGSTFSAILPRTMAASAATEGAVRTAHMGPAPVVLVIDDDPKALKIARAAVRDLGGRCLTRATAAEGLDLFRLEPIALVIVDLLMPDIDGFEFLRRLRASEPGQQVPVVVWTVKDLDGEERRQLEAARTVVISKGRGGAQALSDELRRVVPLAPSGPHGGLT
jgi:CheY-like chemotaxis protein